LDEPTNTLDPTMRDEFLEQIRLAKAAGKAILFSSHVLQEVEAVCDRVAILRKGKLVHLQAMAELREARRVRAVLTGSRPTRGPGDSPLSADAVTDGRLDLEHRGPLPELLAWLGGLSVSDLQVEPLGLGKIYRGIHVGG
jgi:ABC-2 type transport system ATP-binding protein